MVIWNALEDLRRRENRKRGYVEVKTPLLYDEETYETSGHWQNYREHIFWVRARGGARRSALKPMNCPGHCCSSARACAATATCRFASRSPATLHRDELTGTLHGLLRVRHITQDDAHIFCTPEQIEDEVFACLDFASLPLRPLRHARPVSSSRRARITSSAPTRSGTSPRPRSAPRSTAAGSSTS